jgi:8-oxo-dGTP pyrophosphatase MutT (NUDIX family)
MKREFSAGGVVYRKLKTDNRELIEWLVCKHSGYKKWVLPKGLIDDGETAEIAAVREVAEETGVRAKIIEQIKPVEKYTYTLNGERVFKIVQYFLMEYVSGNIADHDWEMEAVEWLPFEAAYARLEFSGQKKILKKAAEAVGFEPTRAYARVLSKHVPYR